MNKRSKLFFTTLFFGILISITGVLGCLDKDGLPQAQESSTSNVILQRISSAGGTVTYDDVELYLNESSLNSNTIISIISSRESEIESLVKTNVHVASEIVRKRAYTINPAGFVFNRPVILKIPLESSSNEFYPLFSIHKSNVWTEPAFEIKKIDNKKVMEITLEQTGHIYLHEKENPGITQGVVITLNTPEYLMKSYQNVVSIEFSVTGASNEVFVDLYSSKENTGFSGNKIASNISGSSGIYYWNVVDKIPGNYYIFAKAVRESTNISERSWDYAQGSAQVLLADLTGPDFVSVTHVDAVDTDYIFAGDYTEFLFNEPISAYKLAENIYPGVVNQKFSSGSGSMSGSWHDLSVIIGDFDDPGDVTADSCEMTMSADGMRIRITLGGVITGDSEPNGLYKINTAYLFDRSENRVNPSNELNSGVPYSDLIFASGEWRDRTGPVMLSAVMADLDSPATVEPGDNFTVEFNEAIDIDYFKTEALTISGVTDNGFGPGVGYLNGSWKSLLFMLGSFSYTGTFISNSCTISVDSEQTIFTITLGGTISNTTNLPAGNFFPASRCIRDVGKNPLDESIYKPIEGTWRDIRMPYLTGLYYFDSGQRVSDTIENISFGSDATAPFQSSMDAVSAYDSIVLAFSEPMSVDSFFNMAFDVPGLISRSLAYGSGYIEGTWLTITSSIGDFEKGGVFDCTKVFLELSNTGEQVKITLLGDIVNADNRPSGQFFPIGIYLNDIAGNSALRSNSIKAVGAWEDGIRPVVTSVEMVDGNSPDEVTEGDILRFTFDQPMSADLLGKMVGGVSGVASHQFMQGSGFLMSDFRTLFAALGSVSHNGNFQSSDSLLSISEDGTVIDLRIGSNILNKDRLFSGQFVASETWLADQPGNSVNGISVEITGFWTENNRPEVESVSLHDSGQTGPEAGDWLEITYSEAINYTRLWQIANDKNSVINKGLVPGSGSMTGPIWDLLGSFGQFTVPGDVQASITEVFLSQDSRTLSFYLGGTVSGVLSPAGHFSSSSGYVFDSAGNPVLLDKLVAALGDFGSIPKISGLEMDHIIPMNETGPGTVNASGINSLSGALSIAIFLDIKSIYKGNVQFEYALDSTDSFNAPVQWNQIPDTDITPKPLSLERGSHSLAWLSSNTLSGNSIDKYAYIKIRARASRDDASHTGDYSVSPVMKIFDLRDYINFTAQYILNSEQIDPDDHSGSGDDLIFKDSYNAALYKTGLVNPYIMQCTDFFDIWTMGSVYENAFEWHAAKSNSTNILVSDVAVPVMPIHFLSGKAWSVDLSGLTGQVNSRSVQFSVKSVISVPPDGWKPSSYIVSESPYLRFELNTPHQGNTSVSLPASEPNEFNNISFFSGSQGYLNLFRGAGEYRVK